MAHRPLIVGIVNITEDSFSDGGRYLDAESALRHARHLREQGADVVELGPAASNPDSARVQAEEECRRLDEVMGALAAEGVPLSVDTFLPETQRYAAARGVAYLNDIQGFPYPQEYQALADSPCRLVVMHSVQRSGPATKVATRPDEVWAGIEEFFTERLAALEAAGISRDRVVIDPGLGYFLGSNPETSFAVLGGVRSLKSSFGVPVMISASRKSFLRTVTGRSIEASGSATLAAEIHAALQGADYIRTHDVGALHDALTVFGAVEEHAGALLGR
ncbi:dihydropteroate synthase [Streptacidiphilus jiangxiensis]|uniref:Dihydropteroate synthase n=1 Tax=Streptacidiphilus jiangxiensis TaxID=235985 RepID=A0A1H7VL06_STRJI|nr:dihydropteroate synthase [Streptacidiphilus jiangxiensis]SEM09951.1 dihydropteroate synthase type 2/dihydropteroate synthase type 3 [Streptacidiphilus jiangxiensis]